MSCVSFQRYIWLLVCMFMLPMSEYCSGYGGVVKWEMQPETSKTSPEQLAGNRPQANCLLPVRRLEIPRG